MNMRSALAVGTTLVLAGSTFAANLEMSYSETSLGGGLFSYDITMGVDTSQSAWQSGMGWSWIIFGDAPFGSTSPFADFTLTSAAPAPFAYMEYSTGGNNGPTWLSDSNGNEVYWTPTTAADTVSWTGTSSYDAATKGPLYFSDLDQIGGASADNFVEMTPTSAPEPSSIIALAGLGLALVLRKRH